MQRIKVVRRMYELRFPDPLDPALTLQQIRGKEGIRVRETYARWSRETGVKWDGRAYKQSDWKRATPINRALSAANSCLYGVAHAAIVAAGYSPGLGFIHTGKMLSFVYDIADLYKAEIAVPIAFDIAAAGVVDIGAEARRAVRDHMKGGAFLERCVRDIKTLLLEDENSGTDDGPDAFDADVVMLWDDNGRRVAAGTGYGADDNGFVETDRAYAEIAEWLDEDE